jgi:hypothetical protein
MAHDIPDHQGKLIPADEFRKNNAQTMVIPQPYARQMICGTVSDFLFKIAAKIILKIIPNKGDDAARLIKMDRYDKALQEFQIVYDLIRPDILGHIDIRARAVLRAEAPQKTNKIETQEIMEIDRLAEDAVHLPAILIFYRAEKIVRQFLHARTRCIFALVGNVFP